MLKFDSSPNYYSNMSGESEKQKVSLELDDKKMKCNEIHAKPVIYEKGSGSVRSKNCGQKRKFDDDSVPNNFVQRQKRKITDEITQTTPKNSKNHRNTDPSTDLSVAPDPLPMFIEPYQKIFYKGNLYCHVCDIYVNSFAQLRQHNESLRHLNMVKGIPPPPKEEKVKDKKQVSEKTDIDELIESSKDGVGNLDVPTSSGNLSSSSLNTSGLDDTCSSHSSSRCSFVNENTQNEEANTDKNSTRVISDSNPQPPEKKSLQNNPSEEQKKPAHYKCTLCNIVLNSNVQLNQHLKSNRHLALLQGRKPKPKWVPYHKYQENLMNAKLENLRKQQLLNWQAETQRQQQSLLYQTTPQYPPHLAQFLPQFAASAHQMPGHLYNPNNFLQTAQAQNQVAAITAAAAQLNQLTGTYSPSPINQNQVQNVVYVTPQGNFLGSSADLFSLTMNNNNPQVSVMANPEITAASDSLLNYQISESKEKNDKKELIHGEKAEVGREKKILNE